jgi:hypothetical protein
VPITLSFLAVVDVVVVVPVVVVPVVVVVVVGMVAEEGGATSYKMLKCVMMDLAANIGEHQHRLYFFLMSSTLIPPPAAVYADTFHLAGRTNQSTYQQSSLD